MAGLILLFISIYFFLQRKYTFSILIFFLFVTNGFQIIPSEVLTLGLPLDKASDYGLLYVLIISWMRRKYLSAIFKAFPIFRLVIYLLIFVIISALYSILILNYSTTNVVQVLRPYLFFLSFIVFASVPIKYLIDVFHKITILTIFQCSLFLLQIVVGKSLLFSSSGGEATISVLEGAGYTRFYNAPVFHKVAFFYLLFVRKFDNPTKQILGLSILALTIVGPLHRSTIMSMVIVLSIYVLLRQGSAKRFLYISGIGILSYIISFVDIISNRIDEAFFDIQNTFSSNLTVQSIDISANTSLFRIGHFLERFNYIIQSPEQWIFGIGLISDNASYAAKLPFQFGLVSEINNQVIQIDTGDLIWSPLILNLGIAGTILYAFIFIKFLLFFYSRIDFSKYATIGFLSILSALIISVTGTEMISHQFRIMILLIAVIVYKQSNLAAMNKRTVQ